MNRDQATHAALASTARRRVLDALTASSVALDAHAIAERLGLHVTTVRFHLDQLEHAGLARRQSEASGRRGRPRILFRADGVARDESTREQMVELLATALATRDDETDRAVEAGRRWADALHTRTTRPPSSTLVEAFDLLGFEPELDGDEIRLHGCPFRDAARSHPEVICSVHRGLIDRLLERSGSGTSAHLTPFVEPRLCTVALAASRTA
ncbi:metalloregulator ArsR/SmtB family transcription factor [Agromyces sp. Marseille-P2726]|uniref:helix-turn-helix transcriptional regulator n=1 Tax=Agromyces sp. Marseille-P2726 TaxID=2709132 RepID=UPI00156E03BF|nr:helix-turn-helix domain-containing protein [Agromyces sp. Marseille-P2726]